MKWIVDEHWDSYYTAILSGKKSAFNDVKYSRDLCELTRVMRHVIISFLLQWAVGSIETLCILGEKVNQVLYLCKRSLTKCPAILRLHWVWYHSKWRLVSSTEEVQHSHVGYIPRTKNHQYNNEKHCTAKIVMGLGGFHDAEVSR